MGKKNTALIKRLIQARRNVKNKLATLKLNRQNANTHLESVYKPIANVLLESIVKNPLKVELPKSKRKIKKEERKEEEEEEEVVEEEEKDEDEKIKLITTPTGIKRKYIGTPSNIYASPLPPEQRRKIDRNLTREEFASTPSRAAAAAAVAEQPSLNREQKIYGRRSEVEYISSPTTEEHSHSIIDEDEQLRNLANINEQSFNEYLNQFDELPREYIKGRIYSTEKNEYDDAFLSHDLITDQIKFGDSIINFKGADFEVKNETFKGTPGLYELIFKRKPNSSLITLSDEKNYGKLIQLTNANKTSFKDDGRTYGTKSDKYRNFVKPILNKLNEEKKKKTGGGFEELVLNKKPVEYVFWDDPNELVSRLQLLIASTTAGNNSHSNEIKRIIKELRESGVIE